MSSLGGEHGGWSATEPAHVHWIFCALVIGAELAVFWWLA